MKIGFLGLGKLGLPCALAIESKGYSVYGTEIDPIVIQNIQNRELEYNEEGALSALRCSSIQVVPTKQLVNESDIIFVAIQTPHSPQFEGVTRLPYRRENFNYSALEKGIKDLNAEIQLLDKDKIVVIISTVLPGTIKERILPIISPRFKLVYNPFFIAMGTTMKDFLDPEFVLLGVQDNDALIKIKQFYSTIHNAPIFQTDVASAELAKVAYNTYISMKICFINTMMEICHKTDANIDSITEALSLGTRRLMSPAYLRGGMGDGGGVTLVIILLCLGLHGNYHLVLISLRHLWWHGKSKLNG